MSTIVYAGAAQFAAVGYVASGLAWPGIILLTALLNARHLLYSAALRPWLRDVPLPRRAVMAHLLTDESFALAISHFRRIGRTDERGYWLAAIGPDGIFTVDPRRPWPGVVLGAQIPDPARLGIDVIFPAAMIGLAVGLITGRRELVGGDRRGRCRGRRRAGLEPVDRDRQRRDHRTAGRPADPEAVRRRSSLPPGTLDGRAARTPASQDR